MVSPEHSPLPRPILQAPAPDERQLFQMHWDLGSWGWDVVGIKSKATEGKSLPKQGPQHYALFVIHINGISWIYTLHNQSTFPNCGEGSSIMYLSHLSLYTGLQGSGTGRKSQEASLSLPLGKSSQNRRSCEEQKGWSVFSLRPWCGWQSWWPLGSSYLQQLTPHQQVSAVCVESSVTISRRGLSPSPFKLEICIVFILNSFLIL